MHCSNQWRFVYWSIVWEKVFGPLDLFSFKLKLRFFSPFLFLFFYYFLILSQITPYSLPFSTFPFPISMTAEEEWTPRWTEKRSQGRRRNRQVSDSKVGKFGATNDVDEAGKLEPRMKGRGGFSGYLPNILRGSSLLLSFLLLRWWVN